MFSERCSGKKNPINHIKKENILTADFRPGGTSCENKKQVSFIHFTTTLTLIIYKYEIKRIS